MKLAREVLLAAIKAASSVVATSHSVPIFTKVWMMEDHVLAFNNTGMVIFIPIEMPALGGVDGKLLAQLLDKSDEDDVVIESIDGNKAKITIGRSTATLAIMDPSDYVRKLAEVPSLKDTENVIELACSDLDEDIELDALLSVGTLKHEQANDFSSLTIVGQDGKATLFTSDRVTINRTLMKLNGITEEIHRLVPIDFLRALRKQWDMFSDGILAIDREYAIVTSEDGAVLYTKLLYVETATKFKEAVGRMWPNGKVDIKTLVDIPERLKEVLTRASLFTKSDDGMVTLTAADGKLLITAQGPGGGFNETIKFNHPPQKVTVTCKHLLEALPYVDRIYLADKGAALFGPKRFSRFISGRSV